MTRLTFAFLLLLTAGVWAVALRRTNRPSRWLSRPPARLPWKLPSILPMWPAMRRLKNRMKRPLSAQCLVTLIRRHDRQSRRAGRLHSFLPGALSDADQT
jgi:hypothetical protein